MYAYVLHIIIVNTHGRLVHCEKIIAIVTIVNLS